MHAIEASISEPIFVGLAGLNLLRQDEFVIEAHSPDETSFIISRRDLEVQKLMAQEVIDAVEAVRLFILQKG